jgi:hypothetical protein
MRVAVLLVALAGALPAVAQERPLPAGTPLPDYAKVYRLGDLRSPAQWLQPVENGLPSILLTGYWPPTNEMLRQFSTNPQQNPGGWVGDNWERRGFNVYSFFPEFPHGLGKGEGDFEVDYQDTSNDFWPLLEQLKPLAIISFGRADDDLDWELEGGNRTYAPEYWYADYQYPYQPTPELPITKEPHGRERLSSLPLQAIVDAVSKSGANVYPYYTTMDDSLFLCDFMGYHVNWWHDQHADPNDPARNVMAGFIHLGSLIAINDAILATKVTVRTVARYLHQQVLTPGDLNCDGLVNNFDIDPFTLALSDPGGYQTAYPDCNLKNGDCNGDGVVNNFDIDPFVKLLTP